MNVATRCKEKIKTERQWNLEGFKVKDSCEGERMWTNQFCGNISTYFRETEVVPMNPDEKTSWLENDRLRRNEMARESHKKRIDEEKRWREQMQREEEAREKEWREWKEASAAKVEELKTGPNRLAAIAIEPYGTYFYEVPDGTEPKTQGMFPFGEMDVLMTGVVRWIVSDEDLEKLANTEEWFPYGLKKMQEGNGVSFQKG